MDDVRLNVRVRAGSGLIVFAYVYDTLYVKRNRHDERMRVATTDVLEYHTALSLKSGYEEWVQIQILIPPLPPWVKVPALCEARMSMCTQLRHIVA